MVLCAIKSFGPTYWPAKLALGLGSRGIAGMPASRRIGLAA
jgi:hypothetical protein